MAVMITPTINAIVPFITPNLQITRIYNNTNGNEIAIINLFIILSVLLKFKF